MLGIVNKLLKTKFLLTSTSNVLPLHLKQTFPPIVWIFTEDQGDGLESRLSFKIFSTLAIQLPQMSYYDPCKHCAGPIRIQNLLWRSEISNSKNKNLGQHSGIQKDWKIYLLLSKKIIHTSFQGASISVFLYTSW